MIIARRKALMIGGSVIAALAAPTVLRAAALEVIKMQGTHWGAGAPRRKVKGGIAKLQKINILDNTGNVTVDRLA